MDNEGKGTQLKNNAKRDLVLGVGNHLCSFFFV